ncbi:MAG: peptidoglycan editing factor PgeF [Desulfobulbaceae bacterium]|jgi:YfiH family protein|nr:peptidoglycan editing factor PgeF [Desulfobulbaceae bacterium]
MNPPYPIIDFPGGHCLFAGRLGGVSGGPYASLNVGFHVGDHDDLVLENRRLLKNLLGATYLVSARQTHSVNIFTLTAPPVCSDRPRADREIADCDALITDQPGVALMIQHADCQPVLVYEPNRRVVAAIHNGWRGSVANILAATVAHLRAEFHCRPQDLRALIGPSLGPCCGEFVGYREHLPPTFQRFMPRADHFNFWRISEWQLLEAGLAAEHIQLPTVCTRCQRDFFSHRRAMATGLAATGRNASLIMLTV